MNVVAVGDSITEGFPNLVPYTTSLSLDRHWAPVSISNLGTSGETMQTMLANYSTSAAPLYKPGYKNILILEGCSNDLAGGTSPSTCYGYINSYVADAHATGYTILVWTVLSKVGIDSQKDTLNTSIVANSAGADGIVNFTSTPLGCDGCYTNTTWFQADGIHPNQAGIDTYEAPVNSTEINTVTP